MKIELYKMRLECQGIVSYDIILEKGDTVQDVIPFAKNKLIDEYGFNLLDWDDKPKLEINKFMGSYTVTFNIHFMNTFYVSVVPKYEELYVNTVSKFKEEYPNIKNITEMKIILIRVLKTEKFLIVFVKQLILLKNTLKRISILLWISK